MVTQSSQNSPSPTDQVHPAPPALSDLLPPVTASICQSLDICAIYCIAVWCAPRIHNTEPSCSTRRTSTESFARPLVPGCRIGVGYRIIYYIHPTQKASQMANADCFSNAKTNATPDMPASIAHYSDQKNDFFLTFFSFSIPLRISSNVLPSPNERLGA